MQIKNTKNYKKFKKLAGNRRVTRTHVKRLRASISEDPVISEYNPILTNEKMEIIDGQHRFEALKELELPIYYIETKDLDLKDVQRINNNQRNWSAFDFARSYAEKGNKNYKLYLKARREFDLKHTPTILGLTMKGGSHSTSFRSGNLRVPDEVRSWDLFKKFKQVAKYYEKGDSSPFTGAFLRLYENPEYDHNWMLTRLEAANHKFRIPENVTDALRQYETIYNYAKSEKNRTRFF